MERTITDGLRCIRMLRAQLDLLCRLQATQEIVRTAVLKRDWEGFDTLVARMDAYANEFSLLEEERLALWRALGLESEGGRFYQSIVLFPEEERLELSTLFRRLKLETLRVKLANDTLAAYIQQAKLTIHSFLNAAFPDRRGRLYSRRGHSVDAEMRSIVLDRTF